MALSTQKDPHFDAFKLQTGIFTGYVAMWAKTMPISYDIIYHIQDKRNKLITI